MYVPDIWSGYDLARTGCQRDNIKMFRKIFLHELLVKTTPFKWYFNILNENG
jgi:hypothetical protein